MDLQTAADRLGVHYQTAYRWVREGALPAVKRGAFYDISEEQLGRFQQQRAEPAPPPRQAKVRSWEHQVDRLFALLREGDELGARQLLDRLRDGQIEPLVLCAQLFTPALALVGAAWARGDINVAEEHRASEICERLLARLAVHPRGRPRGVCVVATPVGEEHGLPAAMAALVLRADRWQVHHLGTQVPTADLLRLTAAVGADLVCLSVVNPEAVAAAREVAERIRTETTAVVLVGAPGTSLEGLVSAARGVS